VEEVLMPDFAKPRVIGFNHVALEVGDIDQALTFYGRLFRFELRGKSDSMAFIDLGDQFIALQKGRRQPADDVATSVSSSTTRKRHARQSRQRVLPYLTVRSLIFGTRGAIV
jgi:catechol 2,3-dioxygenase-like lactoylglutathione lyase family enzyme